MFSLDYFLHCSTEGYEKCYVQGSFRQQIGSGPPDTAYTAYIIVRCGRHALLYLPSQNYIDIGHLMICIHKTNTWFPAEKVYLNLRKHDTDPSGLVESLRELDEEDI